MYVPTSTPQKINVQSNDALVLLSLSTTSEHEWTIVYINVI